MTTKKDYNDENFIEDAEYSSKSDFSKAEIVKNQVSKCNEIRSQEMREGYFNYKEGGKIYIPDSRKEWVSSVIALKQLLRPEIIKGNVEFIDLAAGEKELINKWGIKDEKGNIFIPSLDEISCYNTVQTVNGIKKGIILRETKGKYNKNFHNYWDEKVLMYDELFAQLNVLIHQNNYFKQGVSY